jgi:hypothetical protein
MNTPDLDQLDSRSLWRLGIGVVAGGLMFVGETPAHSAAVISESFESSPSSLFGTFNSYAYSQAYTSINVPPGAGLRYYTGDPGATTTHSATVDITGAAAPAAIDAGLGNYSLSAYFSTYLTQNDWSSVTVQFRDGANGAVGSPITVGGDAFVAALGTGPGPLAGGRDWGQDLESGVIPTGARSAEVTLLTTRLGGTAGDGYTDLVELNISAVPEPSTAAYTLLGAGALGGLLWLKRRSR